MALQTMTKTDNNMIEQKTINPFPDDNFMLLGVEFIHFLVQELKSAELKVYLIILSKCYWNREILDEPQALKQSDIMKSTKLALQTVRGALFSLEKRRFIKVYVPMLYTHSKSNLYTINTDLKIRTSKRKAREAIPEGYKLRESVAETASESVAETASESVAETASESVAETASESVAETASESVAETASVSVAETASVSVAETASVSVAETASVSVAETASVSVAVSASDNGASSLYEEVKESFKEFEEFEEVKKVKDNKNNINLLHQLLLTLNKKTLNKKTKPNFEPIVTLTEKLLDDNHSTGMFYKRLKALYPDELDIYLQAVETALEVADKNPEVNKGAIFVRTLNQLEIDLEPMTEAEEIDMPISYRPEPITAEEHLWNEVKQALEDRMIQATYVSVIHGTKLLERDDSRFRIGVPTENALAWLNDRYINMIREVLTNVIGEPAIVEFSLMRRQI